MADAASGSTERSVQVKLVLLGESSLLFSTRRSARRPRLSAQTGVRPVDLAAHGRVCGYKSELLATASLLTGMPANR